MCICVYIYIYIYIYILALTPLVLSPFVPLRAPLADSEVAERDLV